MGSPGVFIHSGTFGGRLSAFAAAASAWLPPMPPAMTAPPTNAPPSRKNRARCFGNILIDVGWFGHSTSSVRKQRVDNAVKPTYIFGRKALSL
jgi:hypothetical protein